MNNIQKKIDNMFKLTKNDPNFDFSKSGCRVEFVSMNDPYHSLARGSKGTIKYIHKPDNVTSILVIEWDNGHEISLIEGKDNYHITPKDESK